MIAALLFAGMAAAMPLDEVAIAYVERVRATPAIAVARVSDAGVEAAFHGDGVDADTMFEIGSVTKVFTSVLLAELVADGTVTLETTVGELLPDGVAVSDEVASITLAELSRHTSGLPRLPDDAATLWRLLARPAAPYDGTTLDELWRSLSLARLARRGESNYSNLGVAVLGRLLERAAGAPYEALVETRVLAPLGLDGMSFDGDNVGGHRDNGAPTPDWSLDAYAPAGGLDATLAHMTRFVRAAMAADPDSALGRSIAQELGWARSEVDGRTFIWHNGRTGGYFAFVGFEPGTDNGVAVLTNAGHDGTGFAFALLRGIEPKLDAPPVRWSSLGFTLAMLVVAPALAFAVMRRTQSRLHVLDATVGAVFVLAIVFVLGAWRTVPLVAWFAAAGVTAGMLATATARARSAPWVPAGRPWLTAGKVASVVVFGVIAWWVIARL